MRNTAIPIAENEYEQKPSSKTKITDKKKFFNLESVNLPDNKSKYKFYTNDIEDFIINPKFKPIDEYLKEYQEYLFGEKEIIVQDDIVFDETTDTWKLKEKQ